MAKGYGESEKYFEGIINNVKKKRILIVAIQ